MGSELDRMREEFTNLEILGIAIRSEIFARDFYIELSKKIKNPGVRKRVLALASDEREHRRILTAIYKKLSGEKNPPIPAETPRQKKQIEKVKRLKKTSVRTLLQIAIANESEAETRYTRLSQSGIGGEAVRILVYLAGMEAGHRRILESELEMLDEDKNWFDRNLGRDIQLVGP
ncbi:MAG: hypothetical protein Kow0090_18680 [Myxococcota bacterium]